MRSNNCPRCQGSMAVGFILDKTDGASAVASWVEGPPVRKWYGIKVGKSVRYDIETWRCTRCGFLESYAPK